MQNWTLVLVFIVCLTVKVSRLSAAEPVQITNTDSSIVGDANAQPPHNNKIQNNIVLSQAANQEQDATVTATARAPREESRVGLIPMVGGSGYQGNWYNHVDNKYSLGLILDVAVSSNFSLELEGGMGQYQISYFNFSHGFNQFLFGGNTKFYIVKSVIQPYIGAGVLGIHYQNMTHGPFYPSSYSDTVGAGQLIAGLDIPVAPTAAIGVRGSYIVPLFNRPDTRYNQLYSYPYYEEASAMDSAFYRLMVALRIGL